MAAQTICLAGNPNCGKTTLFNALTGARQQVGNWPGVTVERKSGSYQGGVGEVTVVDLPGVYSLGVTSVSSLDERIAREFVLSGEADLVVDILDASNLERNLYLTTQLLEMRVPMLVALNMMDVARDRRIRIDVGALAARLGCPVVPLVASRGDGIPQLRAAIDRAAGERRAPKVDLGYSPEIEQALAELTPIARRRGRFSSRRRAVAGDQAAGRRRGRAGDGAGERSRGSRPDRGAGGRSDQRRLRHPHRRQPLRVRQRAGSGDGTAPRRRPPDRVRPHRSGGAAPDGRHPDLSLR